MEAAKLKNYSLRRNLLLAGDCGKYWFVKTVDFNAVKRQEARSRMAAARRASRSPAAAAANRNALHWSVIELNGASPISSRSPAPCPNGRNRGLFPPAIFGSPQYPRRTGQPYLLIGGQAVNYWAERYLATEPQLKSLQPFTSEDIDFKGGSLMSSASPGNWSWLRVIRPRCK